MSSALNQGCLRIISTVWVDVYHALIKTKRVQEENTSLSMIAIRQDLESCQQHLVERERTLQKKVDELTIAAKERLQAKDLAGARRRLFDRKRNLEQLTKISNSIAVIESHSEAIENTTWNRSLLDTLKASATAIRSLNVKGGIQEVEDVIATVEQEMENANEINKVLYNGSISGTMNSMSTGEYLDDRELERDLEDLLKEDEVIVDLQSHAQSTAPALATPVADTKALVQDDAASDSILQMKALAMA